MKLYINDCDLNTLKIISVAEFYGIAIKLERSSQSDDLFLSKLPILETDNGFRYFSANAACRLIVESCGKCVSHNTDAWLEWESLILQPYVSHLLKASKGSYVENELLDSLQYLNAILAQQNFLSEESTVGLADIVLWATVNPIFGTPNISKDFCIKISVFENIRKWFETVAQEHSLPIMFSKATMNTNDGNLKGLSCRVLPLPVGEQKLFIPLPKPESLLNADYTSTDDNEAAKVHVFSEEEILKSFETWMKGSEILPPLLKHDHPKLPKEHERNILITSALPYVNNVPHLGNIIGAVLSADVFARYCRCRNYNILYICGTDEYGTATETKAIEENLTPSQICDKYNKLHTDIYEWFNISFDFFGRTTTEQQTRIAQDIFFRLHERGELLEDIVEQLYCESCQRFLADRFVEGICPFCLYEDARGDQCDKCGKLIHAPELKQPQCKICRSTPHMRSSRHLFLNLPKLEPKLRNYLDEAMKAGYWSNTAKVITNSWLKEGLKPRCITRDLMWGTPVPLEGFEDKVFYVWFDAPIGYLSITANYTDQWEKWWKQPKKVQLYQFMAKDNVPFHSIIFPASVLGAEDNYTVVNNLIATEYLNYEDSKFSKSRGIGVFGNDAKDTGIPSDIWRFYLLYMRPENQDSYFSWNDLMLKNNSELLNNLGNFINRALMFINNNFGGTIPEMRLKDDDKLLLAQINLELQSYIAFMEKTKLRDAIKPMLNISRLGNQYIQSKKPWELIKGSAEAKSVAGTVLGLSANIACLLCTLMEPYMPNTTATLRLQLNTLPEYHILVPEFLCLLHPGHILGKPLPLFKKIDQDTIAQLKEKFAGKQSPEKTSPVKAEVNHMANNLVADKSGLNNEASLEEIEKLNNMVTEQGDIVRQLKAKKADKVDIDKEVASLLNLKKKLALLKGENPEQTQSKGKKKKR